MEYKRYVFSIFEIYTLFTNVLIYNDIYFSSINIFLYFF